MFVVWLFRPQVKLIYGHANNSLHNVGLPNPDPSQQPISTSIYVEKFFLQNAGRKPATDVEFVLSNFPTNVSVFQPREVDYVGVGIGNCMIKIPKIAPSELVIIDCVYMNLPPASITSVKCSETLGREVSFHTIRKASRLVEISAFALFILGIAFVAQVLVVLS